MIRLQYEVVASSWIHHDEVLWKIPSYISAIDGALILIAYRSIDHLLIRSVLLFLAAVLTFSLIVTTYKIYHFMIIEAETLKAIERDKGVKNRQYQTSPRPELEYWFERTGSGIQGLSATKIQIYVMWVATVVLVVLSVVNAVDWASTV